MLHNVQDHTCPASKVSGRRGLKLGIDQTTSVSLPVRKPKIEPFLPCELLASGTDDPARKQCLPELKVDSHQTEALCMNE